MSGTDFANLPPLALPYRATDQLLVVRDGVTYRAVPNGSVGTQWAMFQIRLPSGESGGSFSPPGVWIERGFNYADPANGFGALAPFPTPGRIQLPGGKYLVMGWLTGLEGAGMRARLRLSHGSVPPIHSASVFSKHYSWQIPFEGLLTLTSENLLIAEMRTDRNRDKDFGFGYRTHIEPEIYGSIVLFRQDV